MSLVSRILVIHIRMHPFLGASLPRWITFTAPKQCALFSRWEASEDLHTSKFAQHSRGAAWNVLETSPDIPWHPLTSPDPKKAARCQVLDGHMIKVDLSGTTVSLGIISMAWIFKAEYAGNPEVYLRTTITQHHRLRHDVCFNHWKSQSYRTPLDVRV